MTQFPKIAPDRSVTVALSMGGYVAFDHLRRFPEQIAGVVLLPTSAATDSLEKAKKRQAGIESPAAGCFLM